MSKLVCGVGFNSRKLRVSDENCRPLKSYDVWRSLLVRSTDDKFKSKNPSYEGVSVSDKWLDYSIFYDWYVEQPNEGDWQLDKDILVKGNQIYSPETCCVVPRKINNLFISRKRDRGAYPIGVCKHASGKYASRGCNLHLGLYDTPDEAFYAYKKWKESHVKTIANEFRGRIPEHVYVALCNYKFEITD